MSQILSFKSIHKTKMLKWGIYYKPSPGVGSSEDLPTMDNTIQPLLYMENYPLNVFSPNSILLLYPAK